MITTVKQYGEIRTGTNYLRALVLRNFPDIQVLSYILGDKHSPPVSFDAIWEEAANTGDDAAFNFVWTSTFARRGGASHPKDLTQRAELVRRAPRIARDYATGALGFLVTIKDPYAWVVSVAKFKGWVHSDEQLPDWSLEFLRDACLGYNRNYREWVSFVQAHGPRARIIRYEDLLADPECELAKIAGQFGWRRTRGFEDITPVVDPTQWDHLPVVEVADRFRPEYYLNGEYWQWLPAEHLRLINETIDWGLLRDLGYIRR